MSLTKFGGSDLLPTAFGQEAMTCGPGLAITLQVQVTTTSATRWHTGWNSNRRTAFIRALYGLSRIRTDVCGFIRTAAPKFFALVHEGTPVNIAQTQPEDQTIGKDAPRPRDYSDPDPPATYMISDAVFAPPKGPLLQDQ